MAEMSRENREKENAITLSMGSLFSERREGGIYLVYDVGLEGAQGPPLKTCKILNEDTDLLAWSGSMYPESVNTVLKRTWPESRIINAFMRSYGLSLEEVMDAIGQIENRGPRVFTV